MEGHRGVAGTRGPVGCRVLGLRGLLVPELLLAAATVIGGCLPPGVGTAIEKSVAEARGGRGEFQEVSSLPPGQVLDRFRSVRVLPVERSPDSGPIPSTLPEVLETVLVHGIRESNLFPGVDGPTLVIRVRITTHWPADGASQAFSTCPPAPEAAREASKGCDQGTRAVRWGII